MLLEPRPHTAALSLLYRGEKRNEPMKCPICASENTKCYDSRPHGTRRKRRYRCLNCHCTFTTTEVYALDYPRGRPEPVRTSHYKQQEESLPW